MVIAGQGTIGLEIIESEAETVCVLSGGNVAHEVHAEPIAPFMESEL